MRQRHGDDRAGVRLHVVTGKGGTGKTTVAAALALALAAGGRRVLLVEVEGRHGLAGLFDVPAEPHVERHVAGAPGGGEVRVLAVDPKAALLEYLEMSRLGRAGRLLERVGAIDFATTVAPGLRDVLLTGKVYEAVRRRGGGRPGSRGEDPAGDRWIHDAVVLDAPPTGRIARFLTVNREVAGLARAGPIAAQAASIMELLRSPATAVHLVTVLEEMPVQETADGLAELVARGLPVGAVVVNQVRGGSLGDGARDGGAATDRADLLAGLAAAGLGGRRPHAPSRLAELADGLLAEAAECRQRVLLEEAERRRVVDLGRPVVELPAVAGGIDLGALRELAGALRAQGMA